jgi:hypothetical protein
MSNCIICGKLTVNELFCSDECCDIYEGDNPRKSKGFDFESHCPRDNDFDWSRKDHYETL